MASGGGGEFSYQKQPQPTFASSHSEHLPAKSLKPLLHKTFKSFVQFARLVFSPDGRRSQRLRPRAILPNTDDHMNIQ
jgi:hypothetical protein